MSFTSENPDPSLIGRRSTDGDFISFREAVKMFATKDEVTAMRDSIALVAARVDGLPSRNELEARWRYEDERYRLLDKSYSDLGVKIDDIRSNQLPRWTLPTLGIAISCIFGIVQVAVALHPWRP